jgi:hypothetical protein
MGICDRRETSTRDQYDGNFRLVFESRETVRWERVFRLCSHGEVDGKETLGIAKESGQCSKLWQTSERAYPKMRRLTERLAYYAFDSTNCGTGSLSARFLTYAGIKVVCSLFWKD